MKKYIEPSIKVRSMEADNDMLAASDRMVTGASVNNVQGDGTQMGKEYTFTSTDVWGDDEEEEE